MPSEIVTVGVEMPLWTFSMSVGRGSRFRVEHDDFKIIGYGVLQGPAEGEQSLCASAGRIGKTPPRGNYLDETNKKWAASSSCSKDSRADRGAH